MSKFSTASSHMVIRKKYGHDKGSGLLRTPFGLVTWAGLFLPERSSQSVELSKRRAKESQGESSSFLFCWPSSFFLLLDSKTARFLCYFIPHYAYITWMKENSCKMTDYLWY